VNIFNNYVDRIAQATPSFVLMMSGRQSVNNFTFASTSRQLRAYRVSTLCLV